VSRTPTGVETPDVIDLRKAQRKEPEKQLYQVLEEKEERAQQGTILGTSHTYVLPSGDKAAAKKGIDLLKSQRTDKVDITLRPEELEGLDDVALAAKYEEASHEATLATQAGREDFSDLVAEMEKKRKRKAQEKDGKAKKQKDFKF
jgi:splicing factor 3B subunit 2